MIISASRRTDIPSYYSEWFLNRIREGYILVPNPFNPHQISRIQLSPEVVDCIVFWTKNPAPMIEKLNQLKDFNYYFQFTINPYEQDVETNIPSLAKRIQTFQRLSDAIGKEKVIWRYDPILLNEKYTLEFHKKAFANIATQLTDYTERCMLGFIDHYKHLQTIMGKMNINPLPLDTVRDMAISFKQTIPNSICLDTCTIKIDLSDLGIPTGMCIDKKLIEKITGYPISARKDKNQRNICQCIESIDIGSYDTCLNGCIYCYANTAGWKPLRNLKQHNPLSPKLIGTITEKDNIKDRKIYSLKSDPTLF